jgi:hypothetical protein
MSRRRFTLALAVAAFSSLLLVAPTSASNASCTGQFSSGVAPFFVPFGQTTVTPEVQNLTLGGPNLGQEVKVLLATADRSACPLAP